MQGIIYHLPNVLPSSISFVVNARDHSSCKRPFHHAANHSLCNGSRRAFDSSMFLTLNLCYLHPEAALISPHELQPLPFRLYLLNLGRVNLVPISANNTQHTTHNSNTSNMKRTKMGGREPRLTSSHYNVICWYLKYIVTLLHCHLNVIAMLHMIKSNSVTSLHCHLNVIIMLHMITSNSLTSLHCHLNVIAMLHIITSNPLTSLNITLNV